MKKRGITPLIATLLLLFFVLIVITVVFLWTREVQKQAVEKNAELSRKQLECDAVQIDVTAGSVINIINKGNIKINLIIREVFGGNVRKSELYDNIEPGGSYSLVKSDQECTENDTTGVGGRLCKQTTEVEIIPALRPEGRGAPLVPCSGASKTIRV
ncbi:hypothetical protein HYV88_02190 [Candidatus Woesearchaeota archaeon]|nr:hypothetical protein [Candidatus Woesearchaeota archaeon]